MDVITSLFDTSDFPARWGCGNWPRWLGWLHIVSDSLIFIAYTAIPLGLAVLLLRRRDFPYPSLIVLFCAFILFCGVSHLIEAVIFYEPIYRFAGVWKAGTAAVSLLTSVVLLRTLPGVLSLPSVHQVNRDLEAALAREQDQGEQLGRVRDELEERTAQLSLRSRRMRRAAEAAKVVALQWTIPDAEVVWEVGFSEIAPHLGRPSETRLTSWETVLDPPSLQRALEAWTEGAAESRCVDLELPVRGGRGVLRLSAAPEPPVRGERRVLTGMFRFLPDGQASAEDASGSA